MTNSEVKSVHNIFKNGKKLTTEEYTSTWIKVINRLESHGEHKSPKV